MAIWVPRETWGHPDPRNHGGNFVGVIRQPYLVEHHTPGQDPTTYDEAVEEMQQIYNTHVNGNGWADIGYNTLVWGDFVFEGRGFGYTGAHAPGANSISIGNAFIMDGRFREPTDVERASYQWMVKQAQLFGYLSLNPKQTGHRDWVATTCPGDVAYSAMWELAVPVTTPDPTPPIPHSEETQVYDFDKRPGGVFAWKQAHINYDPQGGAAAYDFPFCTTDDVVAISALTPDLGDTICSVVYPSGKQSVAGVSRWGHPMKFAIEETGFVTVLVEAKAIGQVRVVGRSK